MRKLVHGNVSDLFTTSLNDINAVHESPSNFFHSIAITSYFDLGDSKSRSDLTVYVAGSSEILEGGITNEQILLKLKLFPQ